MPKEGLSNKEWQERLQKFAAKTYTFRTGSHPKKKERKLELQRVEKCPLQRSLQKIDIFGKPLQCECGYHVAKVIKRLGHR